MTLLKLPTVLVANPHWYDYLHHIKVETDGSLEMVDGGGQVINAVVKGRLTISPLTDTQAEFSVTKLAEYHPYKKGEKIRNLPDFSTKLTREDGIFAFKLEMFGRNISPDEQICFLYRTRYVFEVDPLLCVQENQRGNLYNMTENRDFVNSVCIYYSRHDRQEMSLRELKKLGFESYLQT
ncbi:MAG: hypothetical protein K8L91_12935 [Anaerolineae bacterium]|nr:hypothetical protein [Anaerolineae bacterium]